MNKRGFELGWQFLFNLIFIVAIIIIIVIWINSQASGMAMKKQILAKEICILATEAQAKPGTIIAVEHDKKIIIEKQDSNVLVKEGETDFGYLYPCYLKDNVYFSVKGNVTIIEIKEK
ncbi:MAG: hypothetical protein QW625_02820 [Candidatus Nanoarchaeia archaeon]